MARSCRRLPTGRKTCYEHTLSWPVIRTWFGKMMVDVFETDELRSLHRLAKAAMLPAGGQPLDDRSAVTIDRVARSVNLGG